ncbi:90 kDa surface protein, putative [Trypanosoma cruzi]|uniref:90 kDa surface protein, putative n=1 Tax=Trypanosoma cruzi (strain CL Brener) TaxID=353153 RepID=Q4DU14_TRYCC|nr:90 kDa surface protein, putative [Trypanosoma cruzi]EAN96008.1 90 kDa surface protein, putative [Trypanosoma cruzi]|eukprot:XP_817859.1 90 kDa surface protein [Trypanosoma cruzi strain CL Brener]
MVPFVSFLVCASSGCCHLLPCGGCAWCSCCLSLLSFSCSCRSNPRYSTTKVLKMMCRVFCVVLVLALLCCCSCVFAVEEEEPQVTQVDAVCAGKDKLGRWQLRGTSLWYNCTTAAAGFGQMICGMGVGNCEPEDVQRRIKDGAKDGVFTINVTSPNPSAVKSWWQRNVESKAVTVASVPAKPPEGPPGSPEDKISRETSSRADSEPPADAESAAGAPSLAGAPGGAGESVPATRPEAGTPAARQEEASRDASTTNSKSPPAVVENSTDVPPSSLPATPGGAGANSAAGTAATTDSSAEASRAPDSAPAGDPQGAAHSTSAASAAPESPPDPKPTEGSDHSSHDPPVELREETAAAPPTQLSQTGEEGGAAGGAEEDAANTTTETASGEGNNMAASMPAPLSSAPTTNALENSVGTDACFHDTRLHALPPLVLAALTYGTLG